jgi:hypothetical protein
VEKKLVLQQELEEMVSQDVIPPWSPWENPFNFGVLQSKIVETK